MRELEKMTEEAQMDVEKELRGENANGGETPTDSSANFDSQTQNPPSKVWFQRRDSREELISQFLQAQYQKQKLSVAIASFGSQANKLTTTKVWGAHSGARGSIPDANNFAPITRKLSVNKNKLVMDVKCPYTNSLANS